MSDQAPTDNQASAAATATSTTQARRRSSGLMPAFESLSQQKRSSEENVARRQSLSDQHAKGGIFSQLFHNNFGRNAK